MGLGEGAFYYLKSAPRDARIDEKTGEILWRAPDRGTTPPGVRTASGAVLFVVGAKDAADVEASLRFIVYVTEG